MDVDISVIVPTCDRKEELKRCLDSLSIQSYPKERLEVIVVDDSVNGNKASEVVASFKEAFPHLQYVVQNHKGPARARNLGINSSLGKIVAFVDDDCVVDRDWARLMVEMHQKDPIASAVGGHTLTATQNPFLLVGQFLSTCSIETQINGEKKVVFFPTCNVSFKRGIFDKYKFNEIFPLPGGEDLEFFWRLFKMKHRFIWDKDIKVFHDRDGTMRGFIKQAYIYGRGNLLAQYLHKDHPLLKELKTGKFSFWAATLVNFIKIPRFTFLLGNRLIKETHIRYTSKKFLIYLYFMLHKIFYILGNMLEFLRIITKKIDLSKGSVNIPKLLILDITHSCNLSCKICDIWKTCDSEPDIDISFVKKILSQAKKLDIEEIALSGGEPLLRKDIFDILDYSHSIKIKNLGILTNGILASRYMDRLKGYLVDNAISLVISLDSLNPNIHNEIRNCDAAWQNTRECLHKLSLLKKEYSQINFNIISIILDKNLEELFDLVLFARDLGANSLQFQPLLPNNLRMEERKSSLFWVPEERQQVLDSTIDRLIELKRSEPEFIKNSARNLSLMRKYYRNWLSPDEVNCFSADKTILIANQGNCRTCFSDYGDIKRQNLKQILQEKKIIHARERVKSCLWPCLLPCFCD